MRTPWIATYARTRALSGGDGQRTEEPMRGVPVVSSKNCTNRASQSYQAPVRSLWRHSQVRDREDVRRYQRKCAENTKRHHDLVPTISLRAPQRVDAEN